MTTRLLTGDALETLRALPDRSVQVCVTSPPYYGLRDYGHPAQLGLEKTPSEYVEKLVNVFDEVARVLRDDGTLWVNIGDSYASGGRGSSDHHKAMMGTGTARAQQMGSKSPPPGYKPKDLLLIPQQFVLAMRERGWYVRNDIIWAKTNNMPESVTDRCTRSHEYIWFFSKHEEYYYDRVAIMEPAVGMPSGNSKRKQRKDHGGPASHTGNQAHAIPWDGSILRNKRDVWTMSTVPLKEAHFAAFPPELPETCIKAGSSIKACGYCGTPWNRLTEERSVDRTELPHEHPEWRPRNDYKGKRVDNNLQPAMNGDIKGKYRSIKTVGWAEGCDHEYPEPVRCVVLDPFAGSGTTGMVAERLGRDSIMIDLSYDHMQERRITGDQPLFNQVTRGHNNG